MRIAFVNPAMVFDPRDPFTTGVVYLPIGLAYGASAARAAAHDVDVLDVFGLASRDVSRLGGLVRVGITDAALVESLERCGAGLVVFYANQLINHDALIGSIRSARAALPGVPIVVAENSQAVTAYQLTKVATEFFDAGADALIGGEMELRLLDVADRLEAGAALDGIDGVSTPGRLVPAATSIESLDLLPYPAWDLLPLESYWSLKYAHGPMTSDRYLPLLTSRGCPFPCRFCVVPATNNRRWRARGAQDVVDEIALFADVLGVAEYHVEDLNPTINDGRIRDIAALIIDRGLRVSWKIVAGTKLESMKTLDTVRMMAQSGCTYVSISPESGSADLLKRIGKPFDVDYAREFVGYCAKVGIRTQACFVLGFPEETEQDRRMSRRLVRSLAWAGVSEIAVFVIAPVPGSAIYDDFAGQAPSLSSLSFSPAWRQDYRALSRMRLRMYATFLGVKTVRHPLRVARQAGNFARRRFETKMEMVPFRAMAYRRMARSLPR